MGLIRPIDIIGRMRVIGIMMTLCWFALAGASFAQAPSPALESGVAPDFLPTELDGVGVEEHLDAMLPLELRFRTDTGDIARLGDFFGRGRPVIISMNYSSCPMLCNTQLTGLASALRELSWSAGTEYDVVSVSIDPRETVEQARLAKKKYVEQYERAGGDGGWNFLVGENDDIRSLAKAIGFQYHYVPSIKEFAHPAVFILASPEGKITRYIYGVKFDPQVVKLSLVEASEGKVGSTLDQFILYCFHYDAEAAQYNPRVARMVMMAGGAFFVLLFAVVLSVFWLRERRRSAMPTGEWRESPASA